MALVPVRTRYEYKLVCDFCGHIQDSISVPTEHEGEEIPDTCPVCNIGELQCEQLPITEYIDDDDDYSDDDDEEDT